MVRLSSNALTFFVMLTFSSVFVSCNKGDISGKGGDPVPTSDTNINIIQDDFEGNKLVIYANSYYNLIIAFSAVLPDGTTLTFKKTRPVFPEILQDIEGNTWDILGKATSGPRVGSNLTELRLFMGYWFSFAAFFPKVTLYNEPVNERLEIDNPTINWLVDPEFVFIGTFKDGIPALNEPAFIDYNKKLDLENDFFLADEDLMIVVADEKNLKVYPHKILDWHEVVNDVVSNQKVAVSYCPLTGTSGLWSREFENKEHVFGVSGLLFNSNLILYDDVTDSNWSQIKGISINGTYKELMSNNLSFREMNWEAVKLLGRNGYNLKVLSNDTEFSRDYNVYPYGDYRSNHDRISYPLKYNDDRVPNKERVLSVIVNDKVKAYRFKDFE